MFWNKKKEEKCSLILTVPEAITKHEDEIADYEKILDEFTNKYLPLRDKIIDVIRGHNLNHYPLCNVFLFKHPNESLFQFTVFDLIEDYWDGEQTLKSNGTLIYEEIQLDTISLIRKWDKEYGWVVNPHHYTRVNEVISAMSKLEDPTGDFVRNILKCKYIIEKLNKR